MKLRISSELSTSNNLIEFQNDSIIKIIEHLTVFGVNDGGRTARRNSNLDTDTIYISNLKNNSYQIYVNGKLLKTSNQKSVIINESYFYKIKNVTEMVYAK